MRLPSINVYADLKTLVWWPASLAVRRTFVSTEMRRQVSPSAVDDGHNILALCEVCTCLVRTIIPDKGVASGAQDKRPVSCLRVPPHTFELHQ